VSVNQNNELGGLAPFSASEEPSTCASAAKADPCQTTPAAQTIHRLCDFIFITKLHLRKYNPCVSLRRLK
jgi:hypothetical protein